MFTFAMPQSLPATERKVSAVSRLVVNTADDRPWGTSLWIRLADGTTKRVRLYTVGEAAPFEKGSRLVKVQLDDSGEYADSIFLDVANSA